MKVVSGILLMLLSMSMLSFVVNVETVKGDWTGTVYIRADGSIDPPDAPIGTSDNVTYTLTDNIRSSGDGIVIKRDNVVVDGAGYMVQGTGSGIGIDLSDRCNVTIKNLRIQKFGSGIGASRCYNATISENNITGNRWNGVELAWYSSHNSIVGNNITANNSSGVVLTTYSNYNNISRNNIADNGGYGIYIFDSYFNRIYHNNFINNTAQVYIWTRYESLNVWDDGSKGNYWSDYKEKYPNAKEIDESGIWDTPYVIDEKNQDNYPIVPEFPSLLIPPLYMVTTLLAVIIYKRKRTANNKR
ncbi:MAG: NosD domain-containing protein [Candidatus Bathyarchaeia archaeon]